MKENEDIDKLFREGFEGAKEPYKEGLWSSFKLTHAKLLVPSSTSSILPKLLNWVVAACVLSAVTFFVFKDKFSQNPSSDFYDTPGVPSVDFQAGKGMHIPFPGRSNQETQVKSSTSSKVKSVIAEKQQEKGNKPKQGKLDLVDPSFSEQGAPQQFTARNSFEKERSTTVVFNSTPSIETKIPDFSTQLLILKESDLGMPNKISRPIHIQQMPSDHLDEKLDRLSIELGALWTIGVKEVQISPLPLIGVGYSKTIAAHIGLNTALIWSKRTGQNTIFRTQTVERYLQRQTTNYTYVLEEYSGLDLELSGTYRFRRIQLNIGVFANFNLMHSGRAFEINEGLGDQNRILEGDFDPGLQTMSVGLITGISYNVNPSTQLRLKLKRGLTSIHNQDHKPEPVYIQEFSLSIAHYPWL
jgi:hypothetical protein